MSTLMVLPVASDFFVGRLGSFALNSCDAGTPVCDDDAAVVPLLPLSFFGHFASPSQPTPHLSPHFCDPIFLLLAE